jgi:hypothetical protein
MQVDRVIRLGEDAPDDAAPPSAARRTSRLRPGDVVIYSRVDPSRTTAVDVTVSCGKSSSADAAEKRKIGHYTDTVANTPGLVFVPFGLTVEGELGQGAYGLVRRIARSIARRQESVMDDSSAFAHTKARLANALAVALASQIDDYLRAGIPSYSGGGRRGRGARVP